MVWLSLKFNFKIVIISIQKSFLLLILIPFLSGLFHSYSNSISNSFPFLLSISVNKSFPFLFLFPLMEISLLSSKLPETLEQLGLSTDQLVGQALGWCSNLEGDIM